MFWRGRSSRDFRDEIEAHLKIEAERLREQGLSEEQAQASARRAFGNVTQAEERFYESRRGIWLERLWQDLRFGVRMLGKSTGFTAVALLTLALGIGANTLIFSAVYAVLLKPLPFQNSDRLIFILKKNPARGWIRNPISPAEILAWRNETEAFEDVAAFSNQSCVLTGKEEAEEDPCEVVTGSLFPLLGAEPLRGRFFTAEEDRAGSAPTAILSYGLWVRRFGADETVIGRAIELNGTSCSVVGVMPVNFSHLYASPYGPTPALWVSGIGLSPINTSNDYFAVGRLKKGIDLTQAQDRMDAVSAHLEQTIPDLKGWRAELTSLRRSASGDSRLALIVLMGAVFFVLLIACANMANLLLARGAARASEFAVRNALGASSWRTVQQLLTENLLIAATGGGLGILLAFAARSAMAALVPTSLVAWVPELAKGPAGLPVLGFAVAVAFATTLLFGLAPALQSARPGPAETLKETGRSSQNPRSRRLRNALVVTEVALATVLLSGAGLMIRTLLKLANVNMGFESQNVLTLRVPFAGERYKQPQARVDFWRNVVATIANLPGVEGVSVSRGLPVDSWAGQYFVTSEQPNPPVGQVPDANYVIAGPDYFRVLRIPLRAGRGFNEHDSQSSERVAIVNEELARRQWPGKDALGKRLRVNPESSPWLTVVGVAGNVLSQGPDGGVHAEIYVPYRQYPWLLGGPQELMVRSASGVKPETLAQAVTQEVHRADKGLPMADVATLEQAAAEPMAQQRMVAALLGAFAGLALILSAVGTYSVLSYSIVQRTREMGVRLALGAQQSDLMRLVVGDGLRMAGAGIVLGILGASALTRLMIGLLYEVSATDPLTFGAIALLLAGTSLAACYVPARRAMSVDPMVALRHN